MQKEGCNLDWSFGGGSTVFGAAEVTFGADFFEVFADEFEVGVGELLDLNHFIAGAFESVNDFVELELNGARIAILRVLNQEDDEERDDGGGGIHDELPGVGEVEVRTGESPEEDDEEGGGERPFGANDQRGAAGEGVKAAVIQGVISRWIGRCHLANLLRGAMYTADS